MIESIPRLSINDVSSIVHGIATSATKIPASDSPWLAINMTAKENTARTRYSIVRIMAVFDFSVFIIFDSLCTHSRLILSRCFSMLLYKNNSKYEPYNYQRYVENKELLCSQ